MGLLLGRNRAASACIDLSDGLADGVHHIADRSGVGAIIDADALPVEPGARAWFGRHAGDPTVAAITGGDDYELLFAARPRTRHRLQAAGRHGDVPMTRIGVCTADRAVVLRRGAGAQQHDRPMPAGYSHFR
jgi:thiamine-monophosphate kinase